MVRKDTNFKYAQELFSKYSTLNSNDTLKKNILDTFEGQIRYEYFVQNSLSPREFINQFLLHNYPNETTIKSNFINKLLLRSSNHVTIFELNVGNSRIDLCKINGNSIAYEIKTELDSPKRLKQQMESYFKVFEKVYLICSEKNLDIMAAEIPEYCGIYTYHQTKNRKYIFKMKRRAQVSKTLSSQEQLKIFTKRDLKNYFNLPMMDSKEKMIEHILENHNSKVINRVFKDYLKNKYYDKWNFIIENKSEILEIDYQWFFKYPISPEIVYQ